MNHRHTTALLVLLALGPTAGSALAQSADPSAATSPSRAQVRMETKEFLKTHRWDEPSDSWLLKSGVEPPTGVVPRAVVRAQRDEFLRLNRWDEASNTWMARKPAVPTISSLSREQLRRETKAFIRTHRWDEDTEGWVAVPQARRQ